MLYILCIALLPSYISVAWCMVFKSWHWKPVALQIFLWISSPSLTPLSNFLSITLMRNNNHLSQNLLSSASQNTPSLSSMITSIVVLLIVMGGTVTLMDTVNSWSPSRALSSMIDTIAHDSFTPGINVICNGSSAEKSCPLTDHVWKEKGGKRNEYNSWQQMQMLKEILYWVSQQKVMV